MPIKIDLRTDLHKVRERVNMDAVGQCLYASPCAVGAMIDDPADRARLDAFDNDTSVDYLIDIGEIVVPEDQQMQDLGLLQSAFDGTSISNTGDFFAVLTQLEKKYASQ